MTENTKLPLRVRFAPSPTGYLHIGNVRTALFNWLFARKNEGTFILRIEDTDKERSRDEYVDAIIADLLRLGLDWDEGPDAGGAFGPYRQSQRSGIYQKHLKTLLEKGKAYECFCQPEELDAMRKDLLARGENVMYDGRCARLTDEEKAKLRVQGKVPSIRFKVEKKSLVVPDLIRGDVTFDTATIGDFIIMKSDGLPSFHFAVAVDDGEMQITNVIRGEDHLPNTPKHILVLESLGFVPPRYAHLPLIHGFDNQPLSKRHGHVSIRAYLDDGYLPDALINYLALLGWSSGDTQEIFIPRELIKRFEITEVKKSAAIFDVKKLDWMNAQHLKDIPEAKLAQMLIPYMKTEDVPWCKKHISEDLFDHLKKVVKVLRTYIFRLKDVNELADIFFCQDARISDDAAAYLRQEGPLKVIRLVLQFLPEGEMDESVFQSVLAQVKKESGVRGKELFLPLRAALTGRLSGPELAEVFPLLSREMIKRRLEKALDIG